MSEDSSNTAQNSRRVPGKPFQKGDPRINRKGRPRSFDALRKLAVSLAHEVVMIKDEETGEDIPLVIDGHIVTRAELIMREWSASREPQLQKAFVEYAYGKVPDVVNGDQNGGPVVLKVVYEDKAE